MHARLFWNSTTNSSGRALNIRLGPSDRQAFKCRPLFESRFSVTWPNVASLCELHSFKLQVSSSRIWISALAVQTLYKRDKVFEISMEKAVVSMCLVLGRLDWPTRETPSPTVEGSPSPCSNELEQALTVCCIGSASCVYDYMTAIWKWEFCHEVYCERKVKMVGKSDSFFAVAHPTIGISAVKQEWRYSMEDIQADICGRATHLNVLKNKYLGTFDPQHELVHTVPPVATLCLPHVDGA